MKDQFDEANDLLEAANDKLKASGHGHLDISSTSNVSGIGEGRRAKDKETRKEMEALAQHVEDLESVRSPILLSSSFVLSAADYLPRRLPRDP